MRMPGTLVSKVAYGLALGVPGFMSKVSFWLGPPSIHSSMQRLWRTDDPAGAACCCAWAALARTGIHPDSAAVPAPEAASFNISRRESPKFIMVLIPFVLGDCQK